MIEDEQKIAREKAIKKELSKLTSLYKDIPQNKKKLCEGLLQNAAFMAVTLRELQEEVVRHGSMIEAVSGNGFETIKDNPAYKAYNTTISRYTAVINQLLNLLPEEIEKSKLEEFFSTGDDND